MNQKANSLPLDEATVAALAGALRAAELDPRQYEALRTRILQRVRQQANPAAGMIPSTRHHDH